MGTIRLAVLGAGGLGRAAVKLIEGKKEATLVAICDRNGFAWNENGIRSADIENLKPGETVADLPGIGQATDDSLGAILERGKAGEIDGIFSALPNLPNHFARDVAQRFAEGGYQGVFVDALKRTSAMRLLFDLDPLYREKGAVYITGAGATPGLLSAAAVLAAQSFQKVESVEVWWGVGIANWDAYRATIREDIAHLPGYNVEKARAMSDVEVESLLEKTKGILTLHNMEHGDDLLLQRAGVVDSLDQVKVGGVMDTRHAKKPVSTTMTLTGVTFEGKRSSHKFVLGDETSMAANVLGPAMGYMKRAFWLKERGIHGVFGCTEFSPLVMR